MAKEKGFFGNPWVKLGVAALVGGTLGVLGATAVTGGFDRGEVHGRRNAGGAWYYPSPTRMRVKIGGGLNYGGVPENLYAIGDGGWNPAGYSYPNLKPTPPPFDPYDFDLMEKNWYGAPAGRKPGRYGTMKYHSYIG